MNLETPRPYASLDYTPEVARATAAIHEKVRSVIPDLEWPVFAPYIAAINELKRQTQRRHPGPQLPDARDLPRRRPTSSATRWRWRSRAAKTEADVIVLAGVHFMAETAKILSPEKTVLIPDLRAGCSLAASITGADMRLLRAALSRRAGGDLRQHLGRR